MPSPRFIHTGLPKTGTTWLQDTLFPHFQGGYICGHSQDGFRDLAFEDWKKLRWLLLDCHDVIFEERLQDYAPILDKLDPQRAFLFSEEAIAGAVMNGQATIAQRLKTVFGDSEIIIVLREQFSMLRSVYMQIARGFGGKHYAFTFEEFIDAALYSYDPGYESLPVRFIPVHNIISRLRYDRLISTYRSVFGEKSVHVFSYEGLFFGDELPALCVLLDTEKPEDHALQNRSKTMASYIDYKKAMASGQRGLSYWSRYGWALAGRLGLCRDKNVKDLLNFTPKQHEVLQSIFKDSNDWVIDNTACSLQAHGYIHGH